MLSTIVEPGIFMEIVLTRIPLQICRIEEKNICPLIRGKQASHKFSEKLSVAERSKILDFGIIERMIEK